MDCSIILDRPFLRFLLNFQSPNEIEKQRNNKTSINDFLNVRSKQLIQFVNAPPKTDFYKQMF